MTSIKLVDVPPLDARYANQLLGASVSLAGHMSCMVDLSIEVGIYAQGGVDIMKSGWCQFLQVRTLINAPTDSSIPTDIDSPPLEKRDKTVVFFHDESTFMSNEDQTLQWDLKGEE